ncbi:hypothetical protein [Limisalsivibrio acetivorans]|uniref:WYL domain-containing protein n=1 Tax=Limisalsivibrio acetivorans TaxID=1304888 RepID=UPI00138B0958|nr:hypothetical protein [Limisalsivibrio acetivorans]
MAVLFLFNKSWLLSIASFIIAFFLNPINSSNTKNNIDNNKNESSDWSSNELPPEYDFDLPPDIGIESLHGLKEHIHFKYRSNHGEITERDVYVYRTDFYYINTFCELRNDMRTFKINSIIGEIIDLNTGEVFEPTEWIQMLIYKNL